MARRYHVVKVDDPQRASLRGRLVATLLVDADGLVESDDYEGVVSQLGKITELYSSQEIANAAFPAGLAEIARFVAKRGERIGDEGRVLGALYLLNRLEPGESHQAEYEKVASWGRDARAELGDPSRPKPFNVFARYRALIKVWTEHADLTPAPEVLDRLAQLYIAQRDSLIAKADEMAGSYEVGPNRVWRTAPVYVAGIYLAEGELAAATQRVESMGPSGQTQARLLELLRQGAQANSKGADAIVELVEFYRIARPDVALGLCRASARRFVKDYRFPTCLARIAAERGEEADATEWYADAIKLAPGRQQLYDEALLQLDEFIRSRLGAAYPQRSAELAQGAEQILTQRQARWPSSEPPIVAERLHFLIGMLEMHAGKALEAERRFQASIAAKENAPALVELGSLLERTGKPDEAERRYRRALALTPAGDRSDQLQRAQVLEHLGDAAFFQGRGRKAQQRYRSALQIWTSTLDGSEARAYAWVQLRRGILLDRLNKHDEATRAFQAALSAAPQWQEVYASVLSHLVVSTPDLDLATSVWERSKLQVDLAPEWKVYFALWLRTIAARAGQMTERSAQRLLSRLGKGKTWWGNLAQFGAGKIDYATLLERTSGLGEQAEAHYYEGARRLAEGDSVGAKEQFRRVLETRMVSFYEYEMARRLLFNGSGQGDSK